MTWQGLGRDILELFAEHTPGMEVKERDRWQLSLRKYRTPEVKSQENAAYRATEHGKKARRKAEKLRRSRQKVTIKTERTPYDNNPAALAYYYRNRESILAKAREKTKAARKVKLKSQAKYRRRKERQLQKRKEWAYSL